MLIKSWFKYKIVCALNIIYALHTLYIIVNSLESLSQKLSLLAYRTCLATIDDKTAVRDDDDDDDEIVTPVRFVYISHLCTGKFKRQTCQEEKMGVLVVQQFNSQSC